MAHRTLLTAGLVAAVAAQAAIAQPARSPAQAATMTAIAQAESRRSSGAASVVRLRIPVKLTKMVPDARRVSVHCSVSGDGNVSAAARSTVYDIVNGEFDKTVEVVVTPDAGSALRNAKYICRLELHKPGATIGNPHQGTPSPQNASDLYKLARPDAYFKDVISGSLEGGAVSEGLVGGSGGLAVPPKRRE